MKSSTHVRTQPPELEPHAAGDACTGTPGETAVDRNTSFGPVRLLAGGGSAFEQRLLGSTRIDHMPAASRQHLARALNVPSTTAPAALLCGLLRPSRFGKYGSLVGVGALALLAAWAVQQRPTPAQVEPTPKTALLAAPRIAEASQAVAPAGASTVDAERPVLYHSLETAAPTPPGAVSVTRSKPGARGRLAPSSASAAIPGAAARGRTGEPDPTRDGLREELRALEAVQLSVRAGRSGEAQRGLEDYALRFAEGELRLEAELLGLDVALIRGERKQTRERARELLARPDAARYRERLEAHSKAADADADATPLGSESMGSSHRKSGGH